MGRMRINVIGQRFDRLEVMSEVQGMPGYVLCKCDCGGTKITKATRLTSTRNPLRSCGCLLREQASATGKATIHANSAQRLSLMQQFGTNFGLIERTEPDKRNKSGRTGVWFNPKSGFYEAYISIHKKKKHLGRFSSFAEASQAREEAEEEYYAPLIAAKNAALNIAIQ